MNKAVLQEVGIDYEEGVFRFLGDHALYETVLRAFAEDGVFARVERAYAESDYDALQAGVHECKGSSGNASIKRLHHACAELNAVLRAQPREKSEIDRAFIQYKEVCEASREAIRKAGGS